MRKLDTLINAVSITYALTTIENTLSIILLCLNVMWIAYNIVSKIIEKVKNKDTLTQQDFNQITQDIKQIQDAVKEVINDNDDSK